MVITRYNLRKHYKKFRRQESPSLVIALVSDLHDSPPGAVLELLKQGQPDLICLPGDLGERREEGEIMANGQASHMTIDEIYRLQNRDQLQRIVLDIMKIVDHQITRIYRKLTHKPKHSHRLQRENGYLFLREASKIAPVVYSTGNHEWYLTGKDMEVLEECRIPLVDNRDLMIEIKGRKLHIGGLPTDANTKWLEKFAGDHSNPAFKILLMHHPEYYPRYLEGKGIDTFDLILSGHAHGGQWRILGRGIFAPNQGFFPKYHHGVYKTDNPQGAMVVSAGCCNTTHIPRYGNPTEVVLIKI